MLPKVHLTAPVTKTSSSPKVLAKSLAGLNRIFHVISIPACFPGGFRSCARTVEYCLLKRTRAGEQSLIRLQVVGDTSTSTQGNVSPSDNTRRTEQQKEISNIESSWSFIALVRNEDFCGLLNVDYLMWAKIPALSHVMKCR
jgi:hypothetical protein